MKLNKGEISKRVAIYVASITAFIVILFPYIWTVLNSFKNVKEVNSVPPTFFPQEPTLANLLEIATGGALYRTDPWSVYFMNSAIVSSVTSLLATFISIFAGYGFSRFRIRGNMFLLILILVAMLFPGPVILIPTFEIMRNIGLADSLLGLGILYTAILTPPLTWLLYINFKNFPTDFEEAAKVDGCTQLGAFLRVVVPMSRMVIAMIIVFAFLIAWSEFPFALILLRSSSNYTVPIGLETYISEFTIWWHLLSAAIVLYSIPLIALFFLVQKTFIKGLTSGMLRG